MSHEFDKDYWERHWSDRLPEHAVPPHPALARELAGLTPGTALDAGAGEGAEAAWLASHGWHVTAVDISTRAIRLAESRGDHHAPAGTVTWTAADLTTWQPDRRFDLVTTFYAHPDMAQHAFYERLAQWVSPGGTLLIVGHHHAGGHDHHPHPDNAVTDPGQIRRLLDPATWVVHTAEMRDRMLTTPGGQRARLSDVILRAARRL